MSIVQLSFEERQFVIKCYWKYENARKVQHLFKRQFDKKPPPQNTIFYIRDMFEAIGTVNSDLKEYSPQTPNSTTNLAEGKQLSNSSPRSSQEAVVQNKWLMSVDNQLEYIEHSIIEMVPNHQLLSYIPAGKRFGVLCSRLLAANLESALQQLAMAFIYDLAITVKELNTSQALVLIFFHALANRDISLSCTLIELSTFVLQVNSSFISVWLKDNFCFNLTDVAKAMSTLADIQALGVELPRNLAVTLSGLIEKYQLIDHFGCPGESRVQRLVSELHCYTAHGRSTTHLKKERGLLRAVLMNYPSLIEALAAGGADVDEAEDGESLLCTAVAKGHVEAVTALLKAGADPNHMNLNGEIPLEVAIRSDMTNIVNILLLNRADIHEFNSTGNTLLHKEASCGNAITIRRILDLGADVNGLNSEGDGPLHVASAAGKYGVVMELLKYGANVNLTNRSGMIPLHFSVSRSITKALIDYGSVVNIRNAVGDSPLHLAAARGDVHIVRALVFSDAMLDIKNNKEFTPLYVAAKAKHIAIVIFLATSRGDIVTENGKLLHIFVEEGDVACVKVLLDSGFDVNEYSGINNLTPLHVAAHKGQLALVRLLLERGAEVNAVAPLTFSTSLHFAVQKCHMEVVKELLDAGADPNIQDIRGWTPKDYATFETVLKVFKSYSHSILWHHLRSFACAGIDFISTIFQSMI